MILGFNVIHRSPQLYNAKIIPSDQFSCSVVSDSVLPCKVVCQASLSITNSQSLLKIMSIESVMLSNRLILCRPLLLLHSIFLSIRVFSKGSSHQVAKVLDYLLLQNYQKFLKGGDWRLVVFWVQKFRVQCSSVQSLSHVRLFSTP